MRSKKTTVGIKKGADNQSLRCSVSREVIVIAEALVIMVVLQATRILLQCAAKSFLPDITFVTRMTVAVVMVLFTGVVILYAKLRKTPLSMWPKRFSRGYIIYTCIVAVLVILSPSIFMNGYQAMFLMIYGSVVTPVYEELLFRGYLWNRMKDVFSKETVTFLMSVLLFTIWHLGYMTENIMTGNWDAVCWKLVAGFGYGVVLGLVRLKTKNCYATILTHGLINNFII